MDKMSLRKAEQSEQALESAYWSFDTYQSDATRGRSERDNFKAAIRKHFPHWFSDASVATSREPS